MLEVYPLAAFLARFSAFARCKLSPYAQLTMEVATRMACPTSTTNPEGALLLPPFLCSRTFDNGSMVLSDINVHRHAYPMPDGSVISLAAGGLEQQRAYLRCRALMPAAVEALLNETPSHRRILLIDDMQHADAVDLQLRRILARAALRHRNVSIGWALFNLDENTREQIEASIPHTYLYSLPHVSTVHAASLANGTVARKHKYFISFIGRLSKNVEREKVARLYAASRPLRLHNAIVQHHAGPGHSDPTESVLSRSRFPLVLPGDHMHSTRLSEAVCAGGVPVLCRSEHGFAKRNSGQLEDLPRYCRHVEYNGHGGCLWRPPHQDSVAFLSCMCGQRSNSPWLSISPSSC